jgi:hypothetical protein
MTELKIADQNMYGYRYTGPHEPPTRVRVIAGTEIPPDLVDLGPMPDEDANPVLYPEATSASLTAEEQEQAANERAKAVLSHHAQTGADEDPNVVASDAVVSRGTRRQRQQRSGAIPTPDASEEASQDDSPKQSRQRRSSGDDE